MIVVPFLHEKTACVFHTKAVSEIRIFSNTISFSNMEYHTVFGIVIWKQPLLRPYDHSFFALDQKASENVPEKYNI